MTDRITPEREAEIREADAVYLRGIEKEVD